MLLVNAFYVTNGTQTIIFAIFVSMNPPSAHAHWVLYLVPTTVHTPLYLSVARDSRDSALTSPSQTQGVSRTAEGRSLSIRTAEGGTSGRCGAPRRTGGARRGRSRGDSHGQMRRQSPVFCQNRKIYIYPVGLCALTLYTLRDFTPAHSAALLFLSRLRSFLEK